MPHLEFVITRVQCTKDIFSRKHVSYCPFIWIHHDKTLNNRIFRLQERLRIIYNEKYSFFRCFFDRECNFRIFASKIFNNSKGIAPNVFANISISMPPENFSSHYQSGFQLNPGKIGI